MKTVSSLKNDSKVESPKTPGGISRSLLTPCRRVGLSRNWRKKGPSPFISPLSGNAETKIESTDTSRKRKHLCDEVPKERDEELSSKEYIENSQNNEPLVKAKDIDTTPSRSISIPQRKRSKTLITSKIDNSISEAQTPETHLNTFNEKENVEVELNKEKIENIAVEEKVVITPHRTNSKSTRKSKKLTAMVQSFTENNSKADYSNKVEENSENNELIDQQKVCKQKSPENLTKECIVVIQKKIFKKDLGKIKECNKLKTKDVNPVSQVLFDSDSDDVPLSILNKNNESKVEPTVINLDDDDDFTESSKVKVKKLEDKTTSTGGLQNKTNVKKESNKQKEVLQKLRTESVCLEPKPSSQSSFDDDEDFVIDKRTILIRKSYEKVTKPLKAKSTGSITQKDIDNIKARIEIKKKLLLAKAMTEDTEELRGLIKKWQKGCQDALMELMQLMRQKFPDKQYMDYSEILSSLKIPASLVGYDEENDSFITPTDEDIVLAKFHDL